MVAHSTRSDTHRNRYYHASLDIQMVELSIGVLAIRRTLFDKRSILAGDRRHPLPASAFNSAMTSSDTARGGLAPGVPPLMPRSVVAGSEQFCELACIAENQRQLSGWAVSISMALDNSNWELRIVLNSFLMGVARADFVRDASENISY